MHSCKDDTPLPSHPYHSTSQCSKAHHLLLFQLAAFFSLLFLTTSSSSSPLHSSQNHFPLGTVATVKPTHS